MDSYETELNYYQWLATTTNNKTRKGEYPLKMGELARSLLMYPCWGFF
jgi:hypothetical protein